MNGTRTKRHYVRSVAEDSPSAASSGQARRDGLDWLVPLRTDHPRGIYLEWERDKSWPVEPETVYCARMLTAAALMDWQMLDLLDEVRLCTSELVTNAVIHAEWPADRPWESVTVRIRFDPQRYVVLEVEDGDSRPLVWPVPEEVPGPEEPFDLDAVLDQLDSSGRGLVMVQRWSDGHDEWPALLGGKIVRCWWDLQARGLAGPFPVFSGHPLMRASPP